MNRLRLHRVAFLVVATAFLMVAQDFRAKISGKVADATGSAVPNAAVSLLNKRTGVKRTAQSNGDGFYRFDFVDPGAYSVTVEVPGFATFLQQLEEVQSGADLTVDATIKPSDVRETVTVSESAVQVNFNSTNVALTVDQKLTEEIPRFDRNPFKLASLDPGVRDVKAGEGSNPYLSLAGNRLDMGGGTTQKNEIVLDGLSVLVGNKTALTPNQDAVQEVNIQQSTTDAESGHSAGGKVAMVMKSGTNEWHGTAFYIGRNPALNATTDRTTLTNTAARNNIFGGTLGNPIKKNKLFSFFSYEQWRLKTPSSFTATSPTALERTGDYSQSLNTSGTLRTIYDPYSTVLAANGTASRTPFAGNKIPASRFDPLAQKLMALIPLPNATPDNISGTNNIKAVQNADWRYWSLSERVDYAINEKWSINGRFNKMDTTSTVTNSVLSASPAFVPGGSIRNGYSIAGGAIWNLNPSTVLNFSGEYHYFQDDYGTTAQQFDWSTLWPSGWYKTYENKTYGVYFPRIAIGTGPSYTLGQTNFYRQHPSGKQFGAKLSHQTGPHFLKFGGEYRISGGPNVVAGNNLTIFNFSPAMTANTFLSPNTKLIGDEFASLLLGGLDNTTTATYNAYRYPQTSNLAGYVQDDYKLTSRITLNLGLRYEYETPWHDPNHQLSSGVDFSLPNTAMAANPPVFPASVLALRTGAPSNTGQWIYTSDSHSAFISPKNGWMPRAGIAFKINNTSVLRVGFATYLTPLEINGASNFLSPAYPGFDASQSAVALNQGVPVETLSNPFASSVNPLVPPLGKGFGPYLGIGTTTQTTFASSPKREVNNRISVTYSRQLFDNFVAEATYLKSFIYNRPYNRDINQIDPRIGYANPSKMDVQVANPYYNYLTPATFPGPLRNQATVATKTLLLPYPQYGVLSQQITCCDTARYDALSLKLQRPFRNGFNMVFGYNYNYEREGEFFDDVASFLNQRTMTSTINPRHRISAASVYQLPFGKGRRFLSNSSTLVNTLLGGWQTVGSLYWNGGDLLMFGKCVLTSSVACATANPDVSVSGDPRVSNPTPTQWFNTSVFKVLPAYTARTNPWYYDGLRGPMYLEVQGAVSKSFKLNERVRADLRVAAFNLTNRLNRADPDLVVTSATFGQALRQGTALTGRQVEYGVKFVF